MKFTTIKTAYTFVNDWLDVEGERIRHRHEHIKVKRVKK